MQSEVEVDEEGLYTLKIICKGERIAGKQTKEEMWKKYNRFKKLKI